MSTGNGCTIIIVNYNVKELLISCLSSIYRFIDSSMLEVIVVDNNSTDDSSDDIIRKFPMVKVIRNNFNAGFPAANNQALRIAGKEYIFFLNPDTELIEDSFSILRKFLEETKAAIAAPMLLNSDMTLQKSVFRFPKIRYIILEMLHLSFLAKHKYYSDRNFKQSFEVDSASGAALFFKNSLVEKVGSLNEKLFWIEDVDFCFRVKKSGGKILYCPDTKVVHHSGSSARKNYNVSISNQILNKIKFYKVHGTVIQVFIITLISIANVISRIVIFGILSPFSNTYFKKMKAYTYTLLRIFDSTSV